MTQRGSGAAAGRDAFDVAVVGGGSAGVAAALASTANGARTLLVERSESLGGNVSLAHVHTICGLFRNVDAADSDAAPEPVHMGFARRFCEELVRGDAARAPERAGRVFVLPISPPHYERALHERVEGAGAKLALALETELVAAELAIEAAGSNRLELAGPDGTRHVQARIVVDTSGDGALASTGGAAGERAAPAQLQRPSYIFRLDGVEDGALDGFARLRLTAKVARAERSGELPAGCDSVLARPGAAGEAYVTLNIPPVEDETYHPQHEPCRAELEARGRLHAEAVTRLLRERHEGFGRAKIAAWPRRLGVREGTRLLGRSILEADDILEARRSADDVAVSSWPIELWHDHRRASLRHPKGTAGIPLGALVSLSHPRLAMAGRCMSASHEALGALRVIGTALATGEAAGHAAALAALSERSLWQVEAAEVRRVIEGGAA
jgi:hypothetical protein